MAIQAVIFDVDGVLVSTDEQHYQSWKRLSDEEGIQFTREMNRDCLGASRMQSLEVVLRNAPRRYNDAEKLELAERKNRYFLELVDGLGPDDVLPGCRELLFALKARGIRLAAASGSKNASHILERIGLADVFEALISGHDITRSKPHPEVFQLAGERLGVEPARCLVVEDGQVGVEAARSAGMKALGVGEHELEGAVMTVPSLTQVSLEQILAAGG